VAHAHLKDGAQEEGEREHCDHERQVFLFLPQSCAQLLVLPEYLDEENRGDEQQNGEKNKKTARVVAI